MPFFKPVYRHHLVDGQVFAAPPSKVVCVGRNYAAHARELGNPVEAEPLLFIKPTTALVGFDRPVAVPQRFQPCHYEVEISVLIGEPLTLASAASARSAIAGLGVALDLTLRTVQDSLKARGQPWEKAKAFDGSCVLSPFVALGDQDLSALSLCLRRNNKVVQQGSSGQMLMPVIALLGYISQFFTLLPGDVVLTGTPAGVGELAAGDRLVAELVGAVAVETTVVYH